MPTSTTPLPIGMTSPPSIEAAAKSSSVSPHQIRKSPPLKSRMELVDRPLQQGLGLARGPEHRVAGHAAVDPAGRVALEQACSGPAAGRTPSGRPASPRNSTSRCSGSSSTATPPIRCSASLAARHLLEPGPQHLGPDRPDAVDRDQPVEDPAARLGILDGLRQEVVQIQDLDAALAHLQHEVVVVLLGLVDPDHVVEQQLVAVAGREPLVREAGTADHHGPELADLRVDTEATQVQRSPF